MPRPVQFKSSLDVWVWLAVRSPDVSKSLSVALLVGLALLAALSAAQIAEPSLQGFKQLAALVRPASRRVKSSDIDPELSRVSTRAERRNSVEPPKAAQAPAGPNPAEPLSAPKPTETTPTAAASGPQPDTWSQAEMVAALQDCVRVLAPIAAEVEVLPPMKNGQCGAPGPISLRSIGRPKVDLQPAVVTTCRVASALHQWVEATVQPVANELFGSPVKRLIGAGSYTCRNRNNELAGPISEHAFANAIDIAGFVLADGRTITVLNGWGATVREQKVAENADDKSAKTKTGQGSSNARTAGTSTTSTQLQRLGGQAETSVARVAEQNGATDEAKFLRRMHKGACGVFGTVLGPDANAFHHNHFHLDLKVRKSRAFCQ